MLIMESKATKTKFNLLATKIYNLHPQKSSYKDVKYEKFILDHVN